MPLERALISKETFKLGWLLTPIRAADYHVVICRTGSGFTGDTKICEFDASVLVRKDVCALNIAMDDTLIVQVHETLENLRNIDSNQILRKLSKLLANVMQ